MKIEKTYLGDGLYAEYDGYQFALKANDDKNPTDTVYLEPKVFIAFLDFASKYLKFTYKKGE